MADSEGIELYTCAKCGKTFVKGRFGGCCPYCGTETPKSFQELESKIRAGYVKNAPTALWYLVPFLFGIIGGLIAYVGVKDEDVDMANSLLLFGALWSVVLFFLAIMLFR